MLRRVCTSWTLELEGGLTDLYVPEGGDLHVARPPFSQQEQALLGHGDLTNATAGLDGPGQLIDTLVFVQMLHHQQRQTDLLGLCFRLLPAVVEVSECLWVDLFLMSFYKKEMTFKKQCITQTSQQVVPVPSYPWMETQDLAALQSGVQGTHLPCPAKRPQVGTLVLGHSFRMMRRLGYC